MASTARILSDGIAGMIAAAGLATFDPSGVYAATETGVVMKVMPAAPDRVVVLAVVPLGDDVSVPLGQVMVQVRTRGNPNDPLDVDDLGDSIFELLHGRTDLILGPVHIIQMNRRQSVPMGMDASKRWERADQFYLDVDYPATANRPVGGTY